MLFIIQTDYKSITLYWRDYKLSKKTRIIEFGWETKQKKLGAIQ